MKDNCFIPFSSNVSALIPDKLNDPFELNIPEICKIAANDLQEYLQTNQHKWIHNFGFCSEKTGPIKGKMFGVLVVENLNREIGYLCTFSGKLEDEPHPDIFVPSLFDISSNNYFISKGMTELTEMGNQIKSMESDNKVLRKSEINNLREERRVKSTSLQEELFSYYQFLNRVGRVKSLSAIFKDYSNKKPAAGSGECAAPKLLQYAFNKQMKPLAIAEFWYGKTTKSKDRIHGIYYPSCNDKCRPILGYMLSE